MHRYFKSEWRERRIRKLWEKKQQRKIKIKERGTGINSITISYFSWSKCRQECAGFRSRIEKKVFLTKRP